MFAIGCQEKKSKPWEFVTWCHSEDNANVIAESTEKQEKILFGKTQTKCKVFTEDQWEKKKKL